MKHFHYWPLLIAAVSYVPRAHAAEAVQSAELGSLSVLAVGLGLIILAAAYQRRSPAIKLDE